jgi:hypothetical protein
VTQFAIGQGSIQIDLTPGRSGALALLVLMAYANSLASSAIPIQLS